MLHRFSSLSHSLGISPGRNKSKLPRKTSSAGRTRLCRLESCESRLLLTFHLWKIDQVYSSADGKAQFIELQDPANNENHLATHFISSGTNTFTFPTDLPSTATANHHLLLATAGYAALNGAVTPDYTLPDNFFNPAGDTLDYSDVDTLTFTAGQVPTDGINALTRDVTTSSLSTAANSETNFSGQTGSVSDVPKTGYLQVNLVSDQPGAALIQDPQLVNPWGVSQSATSPFWVSDNGTDVSTIYSGDVAGSPFSKAGLVVSIPGGAPTGQIANGTTDFSVSSGAASGPARFIFASENGDITGWNPSVPAAGSTQAVVGASTSGAVYKGLAMANNGTANQLYAANFNSGAIDVFNASFQPVSLAAGAFTDPNLPAGYAPFNIANIGGQLFVSYALQDAAKHDDVAGFGHGFVDVYDTSGVLVKRLITGHPGVATDPLDSPWGMVLAPATFGDFAGDLLVGNFGNGKINAFDPNSGAFLGTLSDAAGNPIVIDGLWGLKFGNGAGGGDTNTLFFTAGTGGEQHGLLGSIASAKNTPMAGDGTKIVATEGTNFSGTLAAFASTNTTATAGSFTATIDWGDGSTSTGTVSSNGDGGFNVAGSHAYAEEAASETIHVTVSDGTNSITLNANAKLNDATLSAAGVPVSIQQSLTLANVAVATFSDSGGADPVGDYTATIDWGDGTTADAGTVSLTNGTFTVSGSHTYASDGHHAIAVTIHDEGGATATAATSAQAGYLQLNLVSDQPSDALVLDPQLINPWGISQSATSPFWISDNGADVSTIYSGDANGSPFSKAGLVVSISGGAPTGQVANSTSDFVVGSGAASGPARFIFASENGDITGWNPSVPVAGSTQAQVAVSIPGAVFKGLAMANNGTANFLYATDFHNGQVDVFDGGFHQVTLASGAFTDPNLPAGYAPFGIANIGGKLYVTYALQDAGQHDDVAGFGHGFVDVYDTSGALLQRLISGTPGDPSSPLNSPWGLALAPVGFGDFGGDLLVGNFGNGWINAFDPATGAFLGSLSDPTGRPVVIDGLWGLQFGNGAGGGSTNTLFFTAGPDGEQHGLFGSLSSAENTPITGEGTKITPTEGVAFSGNVATFAGSDPAAAAGDFTATINWGDGSTSDGTITANGSGGFNVAGSHAFAEQGTDALSIVVHSAAGDLTIAATATVSDAALHASGVPVNPVHAVTVNSATVATFTDDGGADPVADYTATIDWGDGTTTTGDISASGATLQVSGTHTYAAAGVHTITTSIHDEGGSTATATSTTSNGYLQLNLVSDQQGDGLLLDPNLVNPWGIALSPTAGAFWISDNGADVATLYSGDVAGSPFSKSGLVVSIPGGAPTGQVFNSTADFKVGSGAASAPALFIFASENGDITGWNPSVPSAGSKQAETGISVPGAVFKGLAMDVNGGANFLYATDFHNGQVDVFDGSFNQVTLPAGAFTDPNLPAGYAPFGIANIGGKLYVSYALQDSAQHDDVAGFGHGFVDVYDAAGVLEQRLITGVPGDPTSPLNSPWGMVMAPAGFGDFGGDLLVGNFGDGKINAFDPNTGAFLGALSTPGGSPIVIDGLWALTFGNGASAGDANVLFFSAGSDGEQHGLFGALENAQNTPLAGEAAKLSATEGAAFSGTLATIADGNAAATVGSFSATIDWGDGSTSAGTFTSNGSGGFNISGSHTYSQEGANETILVTVSDGANTITLNSSAKMTDAPLSGAGVTLGPQQGLTLSNVGVATFTDPAGADAVADYSATIDWGDGSTASAGTIAFDASTQSFTVSGGHVYAAAGTFALQIVLHHGTAPDATIASTAQVANASGSGGGGIAATAAAVTTSELSPPAPVVVATFTDGAGSLPAADFSALIDWGDGVTSTGSVSLSSGTYSVSGVHTYHDEGHFTASVSVEQTAGATGTSTPSATISVPVTVHEQPLADGSAGSPQQKYIQEIYRDLFGRQADQSGREFWVAQLAAGASRGAVANDIVELATSAELQLDTVNQLYQRYLHRAPDPQGQQFWMSYLASAGGSTHGLAQAIVGSREYFETRGGGTADGFLQALFQDALGRAIDSAALTFFSGLMANGHTSFEIGAAVLGSAEYQLARVGALYEQLLDRAADPDGLAFFAAELAHGASDESIIVQMLSSDEYFAKSQE